ncbi:MAG: hypothetical protein BWY87_01371 [Deltaproteobacteria bacterium ADurb.Bin510]|nr:MAG: hypothetical protein BWY87_01371 [Deltaproteobacteria bacterium ADurb.Bin510]
MAKAYEAADWDAIQNLASELRIELEDLPEIYLQALSYADSLENIQA